MFCTKCGSPVAGSFCRSCGAPAGQPAAAPPSPPPAASVPLPPVPPPAAAPPVYNYAPPVAQPGLVPPPPAMDYAQWGTRVLGYLVDMLFVGVIGVGLLVVAGLMFGGAVGLGSGLTPEIGQAFGQASCCLIFSVFPIATLLVGLYNKVYLVSKRGASIGQGVVNVRVVDAYGRLLTPAMALLRLLAQVGISFVPFGGFVDLLWPLWDPQRQTLHDKAVSCYVINYRGA